MIFSRIVPWRLMALPTPILVFIVTVVPAPLLLLIEGIKRSYRSLKRSRSAAFVRSHPDQTFFLFTQRPDSTERLSTEVIPAVGATAVLLNNLRVVDKQYAALQGAVPSLLGASFPIMLRSKNGNMDVVNLHDCVYTEELCVRESTEIVDAIKGRLEG